LKNKDEYDRIKSTKRKGFHNMKKISGIQKFVILVLLGIFTFSNTLSYQQFIQKDRQYDIRVQLQKKSNGLDVGKAD
jgi:hypothetical protein